jgi:predicted flap endonuclease-1-like 5' DNA nuclease
VSETGRTDGIASLEAAREQLEAALSSLPQWQALRANADDASRERSEQELENNPLYRSWRLVNEAIDNLRSVHGDSGQADVAPIQSAEVEDAGGPPAIRRADPPPVGSEVGDVLDIEHVEQPRASEPADDLTRIRGIDAGTARALAALGVTRYAQIAAWRRGDVRDVAETLGLTREISRQNWIEQAALLERERAQFPPRHRRRRRMWIPTRLIPQGRKT